MVAPAEAQGGALAKDQAAAQAAYDKSLREFKAVLAQRRAQIDARQKLPNLPGQAVYLARIKVMSTYKDLTDAVPSRIGRPNKFGVPPAYFDADIEPLVEEYSELFGNLEKAPAFAQASKTPFKDVVDLGIVMTSANSDLSPARLDRYLTLLRDGGIAPALVLSVKRYGANRRLLCSPAAGLAFRATQQCFGRTAT